MTLARTSIFTAINRALSKSRIAPPSAEAIKAEADALLNRVAAIRPDRVSGRPEDSFLARVTLPAIGATAERVASLEEFPKAVRRYLSTNTLAAAVALQPHPRLHALDWSDVQTHAEISVDEPVAVGLALGGIAETGSLVFHSAPDSPTLFAFLPAHHIVAVEAAWIWPWLEDYADWLASTAQPRNVNLVTGASGTTDIEGALVRGAHGPAHLHIVLIDHPTDAISV